MSISRQNRPLLIWALYVSLLLNAFACSLGHAQMAGLQLGGAGGAFCSLSGSNDFGDLDSGNQSNSLAATFSCPLCSTITLSIGLLLGLGWLLRPTPQRFRPTASSRLIPPRFLWPSANPRASP